MGILFSLCDPLTVVCSYQGGLGPMSRMWGSCLDHVVQVEVVTAEGKIVVASETENKDLFFVSHIPTQYLF